MERSECGDWRCENPPCAYARAKATGLRLFGAAATFLLLLLPALAGAQTGQSESCDKSAPFPATWTYSVPAAPWLGSCEAPPTHDIYWRWCGPVVPSEEYAVLVNGAPLAVTVTHDPLPAQKTGLYAFTTSSFRPLIRACEQVAVSVVVRPKPPAVPTAKRSQRPAWRR